MGFLLWSLLTNMRKLRLKNVDMGDNHICIFRTDTDSELSMVKKAALENGAFDAVVCTQWSEGGRGAANLAEAVINASNQPSNFKLLYDLNSSIEDKMNTIAKEMYGASGIKLTEGAQEKLRLLIKDVNKFGIL